MKPEFNQQQTDWISQVEELDDIDASQVNGGRSRMTEKRRDMFDTIKNIMDNYDATAKSATGSIRDS